MPPVPDPAGRTAPSPLTGLGVLLWLSGFFCSVFIANFALSYFALRTLPGGEIENAWDASQGWNKRLAESRAQSERGWSAQVSLRAEGEGAHVSFTPTDQDGAHVPGLLVEAILEHPSDRRADRHGALMQRDDHYEGLLESVPAGDWTLQIKASRDGELVYVTRNRVALRRGFATETGP